MSDGHRIVARFSDGIEHSFIATDGQPLLTAALDAGINLLHQCRAGSCSTCICQGVTGTFEMDRSTGIALLPGEIRAGRLLTCLARAKSDAVIEFAYESHWLDRAGARKYRATVVEVERLCDTVTALRIELDPDDDEPSFGAGMYFMLRVPHRDQWRAYSAVTTEADLPAMGFLIRHVPDGLMTDYVAAQGAIGDEIEIEGPFGEFFLCESNAPTIMVAGGTGLAPIIAMLDAIYARRRNRSKILLCFGVTRYDDLFYLDELELRGHRMAQLEIRIAVAVPDERWDGRVGMVTDLIHSSDGSPATLAYVCGPPPMVEAALARLSAAGLPPDAVHYERFAPSNGAAS